MLSYHLQLRMYVIPACLWQCNFRSNLGAVDLNRDWGPFSQPETVAARDALMSFTAQPGARPFLFLDFHATHTNVFYEQVSSRPAYLEGFTDRWLAAIQK